MAGGQGRDGASDEMVTLRRIDQKLMQESQIGNAKAAPDSMRATLDACLVPMQALHSGLVVQVAMGILADGVLEQVLAELPDDGGVKLANKAAPRVSHALVRVQQVRRPDFEARLAPSRHALGEEVARIRKGGPRVGCNRAMV